jgi:hypothetical protein
MIVCTYAVKITIVIAKTTAKLTDLRMVLQFYSWIYVGISSSIGKYESSAGSLGARWDRMRE